MPISRMEGVTARFVTALNAPQEASRADAARERYSVALAADAAFSAVAVAALGVVLAFTGNARGATVWLACMLVMIPIPIALKRVAAFDRWLGAMALHELVLGAAWGAVALVAMPDEGYWRAVLCASLATVVVSGSVLVGQLARLAYLFVVPISLTSMAGFMVQGGPRDQLLALIIAISAAFSLSMVRTSAEVHDELATVSLSNQRHAAGLAAEHERLERANASLGAANRRLDVQARRDHLTGIGNRLAFTERLDLELERLEARDVRSLTIAYLDLDGFKLINDGLGHSTGDRLLQAIAERLAGLTGESEFLARLGGDELILVAPDVAPDEAGARILQGFASPFHVDGQRIPVGVSIGLATATQAMRSDDLLRFADEALSRAKLAGGRRYEVFDTQMRHAYERRRRHEREVADALERGEIEPWLQPIVDLRTGATIGAEALARWAHPDGMRPAVEFIESLTTLGLLDRLTRRFVREIESVTDDLVELGVDNLPIAINVPPAQIEQQLQHFAQGRHCDSLVVELTEESAFANMDRARDLLLSAQQLGLRVYLDDFGMGYSSLALATQLPVSGLKIDRSFVQLLPGCHTSQAVVASVVDLARRLDLRVIAEGIETRAQLETLTALGVVEGQGWLFAPAISTAEFTSWVASGHRFDLGGPSAGHPVAGLV